MGTEETKRTVPPRMCLPVTAADLAAINERVADAINGYEVTVETGETGQASVCIESAVDYRSVFILADNRHTHWGVLDWRGSLLMTGTSIKDLIEEHGEYLIA